MPMQKELGKEIPQGDRRIAYLKDNCDKIETKGYMKRFTPEQLLGMKDELSETAIMLNDLEEAKKAFIAEIKTRFEPLIAEKKRLLTGLKNKSEYVSENCFKFVDVDDRMVGYYNQDGDLIESRPVSADELQTNIFQINRTGTNDK